MPAIKENATYYLPQSANKGKTLLHDTCQCVLKFKYLCYIILTILYTHLVITFAITGKYFTIQLLC